jgi:hypothetical protein
MHDSDHLLWGVLEQIAERFTHFEFEKATISP